MTPCQGHFWPQGHYLNKFGRGLLGDTKYQGAMPCGLRQEDYFMFSIKAYVKHVTPGVGPFLAQGV